MVVNLYKKNEVEVLDLQLTENEMPLLNNSARRFLHQDAWLAAGSNPQLSPSTSMALPVYTEAADEQFWLFYTDKVGQTNLKKSNMKDKLHGYWLNRATDQQHQYQLPRK